MARLHPANKASRTRTVNCVKAMAVDLIVAARALEHAISAYEAGDIPGAAGAVRGGLHRAEAAVLAGRSLKE